MTKGTLAIFCAASIFVASQARADEYTAASNLPAVYSFLCNSMTSDPKIRDCPAVQTEPDPYGQGAGKLIHWTHSWVQVHNTTAWSIDRRNGDEIKLYLYGKDGKPAKVNDAACYFKLKTEASTGKVYLDVLGGPAKGVLPQNGTTFFFIHQCLNDGDPNNPSVKDHNPPTSAVLFVKKRLGSGLTSNKLSLQYTAGWEEGTYGMIYGAPYNQVKAGSLVDKEKMTLQKDDKATK